MRESHIARKYIVLLENTSFCNAVLILLVGIRHGIQRNIEQIEAYISVNDDEVDSLRKATTKLEVDNRKWDLNY